MKDSDVNIIDYYHEPIETPKVDSIHADSEDNLTGDVQLVSGTDITLSQAGMEHRPPHRIHLQMHQKQA